MTFTPHPINPELDLELIREVPVSAQAIFEAWTTPESLTQWFFPQPYSTPSVKLTFDPGAVSAPS